MASPQGTTLTVRPMESGMLRDETLIENLSLTRPLQQNDI